MSEDFDDLEDDWAILEKNPPLIREPKLIQELETTTEITTTELSEWAKKFEGGPATVEVLSAIATQAVRLFMVNWQKVIQNKNLTGLIEIVLEKQALPPEELEAFVRALPDALLNRVLCSAVGTVNGVHALLSIEMGRREGALEKYTIHQTSENRVFVKVLHANNEEITFWLDEIFEGLSENHPSVTLGSSAPVTLPSRTEDEHAS